METKTIVVTGAAGFVGQAVCRRLVQDNLRTTDRIPLEGATGHTILDLVACSPDALVALFSGCDAVVHVAGIFELDAPAKRLQAINVQAAQKVAQAVAKAGVKRFIHISSASIFGRPRSGIAGEDDRPHPSNRYESSKWRGEQRVRAIAASHNLSLTVLRPAGVYGIESRYGIAMLVAMYAAAGMPGSRLRMYRLVNTPALGVVHADTLADAVAFCLATPATMEQTFTVADTHPWNWGEVSDYLIAWYGVIPYGKLDLGSWRGRFFIDLYRSLPSWVRDRINRQITSAWRYYQKQNHLEATFVPRFDRHSLDYWRADHVYESRKLTDLGWQRPEHSVKRALRSLVESMAAEKIIASPQ